MHVFLKNISFNQQTRFNFNKYNIMIDLIIKFVIILTSSTFFYIFFHILN